MTWFLEQPKVQKYVSIFVTPRPISNVLHFRKVHASLSSLTTPLYEQQQIRVPNRSSQYQSQCSTTISDLRQFQFQFHYNRRSSSKSRSSLQSMTEGNNSMDIDPSYCTNSTQSSNENQLEVARPVGPSSSGKGLPYAPENWPSPGDVWTWKVGKRRSMSGHWLDRAVSPPSHLPTSTGSKSGFYSKVSLEQYIRKEFPDKDVDAFFASFKWKILALGGIVREAISEANGGFKSESAGKVRDCKAGNKMCSLRTKARDSNALVTKSCDICCTEPGFCRDCCCILCAKTVDWTHGGYNFIRCEAIVDENFICGHASHIDCALRAYLAGKVGGYIDLDTQFFCRRCDHKSDLMPHVLRIVKTCESLGSRDNIRNILNLGLCILHGSEQERAKDLQNRIGLIMEKLKQGVSLSDIWREEDNISAPADGNIIRQNEVGALGGQDNMDFPGSSTAALVSMSEIENSSEIIVADEQTEGHSFITSDHSNMSIKLIDEVDGVLQQLKYSQHIEYDLAEKKLYAQKDLLLSLYEQLETGRSELARSTPVSGKNGDNLLTDVLNRVEQIKHEEVKLQTMLKIAKGFGETPRRM